MAEGGEVEVRTQTADCGVTRAAREGGGVGKHRGRRCGAAGSCKYPLKGLLTKAYCLGLWVMFERPCRVLQKQRFTPTQGGNESPVDTACKFAARCKHGYS